MLELITFEDNSGRQVIIDDKGNLEITKNLDKDEIKVHVKPDKIDYILNKIKSTIKSIKSKKFINPNRSSIKIYYKDYQIYLFNSFINIFRTPINLFDNKEEISTKEVLKVFQEFLKEFNE